MSELSALLDDEAAFEVPPETSDVVRRAAALGPPAAPELLSAATAGGYRGLLALEALRQADAEAYAGVPAAERARGYADALRASTMFNAWGLPGVRLSPAADALAELGQDAVPALAPLLDDTREAPLEGSQDATTAAQYGNRVADYALVLLTRIAGGPDDYPPDPAERDRRIAALRERLEI
jgi:hypothetical protein